MAAILSYIYIILHADQGPEQCIPKYQYIILPAVLGMIAVMDVKVSYKCFIVSTSKCKESYIASHF